MKIYTKSGDKGTTSLCGGQRVDKDSLRIEAIGNVDELNSLLGVILAEKPAVDIAKKLARVQKELFILGGDLATPLEAKIKVPRITKSFITRLEKEIDEWEKNLPKLKKFILPGGSKVGSELHLARTIARRVERVTVRLACQERLNQNILMYINRLSDWFFVATRHVNRLDKIREAPWKGRD